jgi:hypothetical protein
MSKIITGIAILILLSSLFLQSSFALNNTSGNVISRQVSVTDSADVKKIDLGGITLSVSTSWSAQVFHIVDQLSQWSPYSHKQYVRWASKNLKLNKTDSLLLQQHATLRRDHKKNADIDKAFLTGYSIEEAASRAVTDKRLSASEAATEKGILLHFAERLSILKQLSTLQAASFFARLESHRTETAALISKLLAFTKTQGNVNVPVYLVVNPEEGSGGGEANGGLVVIETQENPDVIPVLIHESLHFLLIPYKEKIRLASVEAGIDPLVVNEGLAYAMGGLIEEPDRLPYMLVRNITRGQDVSDHYTQFYMAGIIVRPMLKDALAKGETITELLPKIIQKLQILNNIKQPVAK